MTILPIPPPERRRRWGQSHRRSPRFGAAWIVGCAGMASVLFAGCAATPTTTSAPFAGPDGSTGVSTVATIAPSNPLCSPTAMTAHKGIAYADAPAGTDPDLLAVDIYQPDKPSGAEGSCDGVPVLVYVHGGGWRKGDKSSNLATKILYAQERGMVLVSVNYRLTPEVTYPVHNEDVADAVAWVSANISNYQGDPNQITLMGHSAGAAIVAAVATDERYLSESGAPPGTVDCVVSLDTEGYDVAQQVENGNDVYLGAFGSDPSVAFDASPINHIQAGNLPRFLLVVQDKDRRAAMSDAFADRIVTAGGDATVLRAPGLDHEGVNQAVGLSGDPVVTPAITTFLRSCAT